MSGAFWSLYVTENDQTQKYITHIDAEVDSIRDGTADSTSNTLARLLKVESTQGRIADEIAALAKRTEAASQTGEKRILEELTIIHSELVYLSSVISTNLSRAAVLPEGKTEQPLGK
jgi:hypothetical protein